MIGCGRITSRGCIRSCDCLISYGRIGSCDKIIGCGLITGRGRISDWIIYKGSRIRDCELITDDNGIRDEGDRIICRWYSDLIISISRTIANQ